MTSKPMTRVNLHPRQCGDSEQTVLQCGEFAASAFRFGTGVCGVRLQNAAGEVVMLPWQGQQIWRARFQGRELCMISMFEEPVPTRSYLDTYGGFLLHCGATAMGVPGPEDSHPLHGELPNAPYGDAYLELGEDDDGPYLGLGGCYRHTVAFSCNYTAEPMVRMHAGSSVLDIFMTLTNLMHNPMEWMYLAHINFRPVEGGRLVYSSCCDPEHVRVRRSIPAHISPPAGYREFLEQLAVDPSRHNVFRHDLPFNPEVCFYLDYLEDSAGWAHSLQVHPDGTSDYVAHHPSQLDTAIRWIANTGDQEAMGLVLPATAEPEGYRAEREKGNIKILAGGESVGLHMRAGALSVSDTEQTRCTIESMLA